MNDRLQVLLAEEDTDYCRRIESELRRAYPGANVVQAPDSDSLLRALETLDPDLVIANSRGPWSDTPTLIETVKRRCPACAVLVLATLQHEEALGRTLCAGADGCMVRTPHHLTWLTAAARMALERASQAAERRRTEEALRELTVRILRVQDEERRRIARELHDTTAQKLTILAMNLGLLENSAGRSDSGEKQILADCAALVEQCSSEIRTLSYLLHPPMLEELGLLGAVKDYVDGFAQRAKLRVELELPPSLQRLPGEIELTLFRALQECLSNIVRHSQSRTASVRIWCHDRELRLQVRDSGRGIRGIAGQADSTLAQTPFGVGIHGMRERLRQLGGTLEIESSSLGTTVTAAVPLLLSPT